MESWFNLCPEYLQLIGMLPDIQGQIHLVLLLRLIFLCSSPFSDGSWTSDSLINPLLLNSLFYFAVQCLETVQLSVFEKRASGRPQNYYWKRRGENQFRKPGGTVLNQLLIKEALFYGHWDLLTIWVNCGWIISGYIYILQSFSPPIAVIVKFPSSLTITQI